MAAARPSRARARNGRKVAPFCDCQCRQAPRFGRERTSGQRHHPGTNGCVAASVVLVARCRAVARRRQRTPARRGADPRRRQHRPKK